MGIHPTAIISDQAELEPGVTVGPYCVIRGRVKIGAGTQLDSHALVGSEHGIVEIGKNNHIYSGAVVGGPPQDLKYNGEPTKLTIGDGNRIREFVTINIGTESGGGVTSLGNDNLLMAYVHVAHDCHLGNNIVIANTTNFAGHVVVEDCVRIGGVCSFNQFITLGRYSYIAGDSAVNKDILPFSIAQGKYAVVRATNRIGLERAGFSKEEVENIHRAIRSLIMGNRTIEEALELIHSDCQMDAHMEHLVQFVKNSSRGLAR